MRDKLNNIDISVIVPLYNGAKYIAECLNSIISQDFNSYEIILIDDGSTDDGLEIAKNILKKTSIPNKIIQQDNHGVGYTRNIGIENSNGRFIVFVDCDDTISKNHLKCLYKAIENNDFAFTGLSKIDENRNTIQENKLEGTSIDSLDLIKLELTMKNPFNFCQLMYKKDLIKELFLTDAVYGEDTDFALKNLINGNTVGICNDITYFYRQHSQSSINKVDFKRFEFIETLENLQIYFKDYPQLTNLIETNRIPKAIFGNMLYFFVNDYEYNSVIAEMERLNLFSKLEKFEGDTKFKFKTKLFLLNPKLYIKMWKRFKNSI